MVVIFVYCPAGGEQKRMKAQRENPLSRHASYTTTRDSAVCTAPCTTLSESALERELIGSLVIKDRTVWERDGGRENSDNLSERALDICFRLFYCSCLVVKDRRHHAACVCLACSTPKRKQRNLSQTFGIEDGTWQGACAGVYRATSKRNERLVPV